MSETESEPPRSVYRRKEAGSNASMSLVGYVMMGGMLILILPVLPFLVVIWALGKITDSTSSE
ncbi:hypothetical protein [Halobacterium sp. R2-5]|uniref:DUF7535 family protein n=1 Tax=Halobacterium sp. R2-5 TaxID=2715751 RepID=UPI0014233C21|nr:hypothetical protein [Halobacterium sp. R2-5]NIB98183.1 hypothetical protein [Halobacterium sp. R2-5]